MAMVVLKTLVIVVSRVVVSVLQVDNSTVIFTTDWLIKLLMLLAELVLRGKHCCVGTWKAHTDTANFLVRSRPNTVSLVLWVSFVTRRRRMDTVIARILSLIAKHLQANFVLVTVG